MDTARRSRNQKDSPQRLPRRYLSVRSINHRGDAEDAEGETMVIQLDKLLCKNQRNGWLVVRIEDKRLIGVDRCLSAARTDFFTASDTDADARGFHEKAPSCQVPRIKNLKATFLAAAGH